MPDPSVPQVASQASQLIPALTGVAGVIAGSLVSWLVQARLLGRRIKADETLAQRKFDFDKEITERKFNYDRELHDHKRRTEIAEQALTAFYEARDVFVLARSRGIFGGEGTSRTPAEGESKSQQERRNTYFVPIERLTRDKELFARLQSIRYKFAAYFGEPAVQPFSAVMEIHNDIMSSASVLIEITHDDDFHPIGPSEEPLRNALGWGPASRPDDTDRKMDKAISDMENICRPILDRT